jgi:flavin-dependent dehydrogenase
VREVFCDIAILGGGPAGTACALALRQRVPQWSVAIFESSDYTRPRAGEVLPPHALPLLRQLRVPLEPLASVTLIAEGFASAWGGDDLPEQHQLFSGHGAGLHLERNAFDRHLAACAAAHGATVYHHAAFQSARRESDGWQLRLSGHIVCGTRFVIDATGRRAAFARSQGASLQHFDALTAYGRTYTGLPAAEHQTLIEACPLGWWYTAPLPQGRRIVSLLTDVDLGRAAGLPAADSWDDALSRTRHVAPLLFGAHSIAEHIAPAATTRLSVLGGAGWLATGDAAASCDPLAGQGITKALRSGILASYAVADMLAGNGEVAFARYEAMLASHFAGFQRLHRVFHNEETRWPLQPFWRRRRSALHAMAEAAA